MGTRLEIVFSHASRVFFPGQRISGKVKIVTSSDKICKGVLLTFTGVSKVAWRDGIGNGPHSFSDEQKYYESEFYVWGNGIKKTLTSGEHLLPFAFILPTNIPGSFESTIGYVRHICSAKLSLAQAFDKKTTAILSIHPEYDLNADRLSVEPIIESKGKISGHCCRAKPVTLSVRVDQSGFVCGEAISICGECTNLSRRKIAYTRAEVVQKLTFIAKNGKKTKERVICSVNRPTIDPGCSDIWNDIKLYIPVVPPSYLQGCSLINILYELHFSARFVRGSDLSIQKPIIIGTVPLRQNFSSIVRRPRQISPGRVLLPHNDPPSSTNSEQVADPPPYQELYPTCPPPSYFESSNEEEAQTSSHYNEALEEDALPEPFKPLYAAYGFQYGGSQ